MQYWSQMNDKYGFEDGSAYPEGIEIYREVYCKTLNRLAESNGSRVRVVPFDRSGCHNYCLVMTVPKRWYNDTFLTKQVADKPWRGVDCGRIWHTAEDAFEPISSELEDEAFIDATHAAMELDLDGFVQVNVKVSEDFEKFLTQFDERNK